MATGEQRERQRAPPRVLPERNGLRAGGARRTRGRARQDQRAAEKMPELENRTRGLHRGSVALNLTNRHILLPLHKIKYSTNYLFNFTS